MPDIRELEERLAQCRTVIGNVLQNMNYIQKEIDSIKKAGDPAQNTPSGRSNLQDNRQVEWQDQHQSNSEAYPGTSTSMPRTGLYGGAWARFDSNPNLQTQQSGAGANDIPTAPFQGTGANGIPTAPYQGAGVNDIPPVQQVGSGTGTEGTPSVHRTETEVNGSRIYAQSHALTNGSWQAQSQDNGAKGTSGAAYHGMRDDSANDYNAPEKKARSSDSAESIFGKKVMAVTASVLIFISLILFAALIIPVLSDGAKFTLMLIVSFGITAFGLIKWFRNKESAFFISVGACGVGSIYISLYLSNIYFKIIGNVMLFAFLLVWAVGVLFLSRYKKLLFELIGNIGITISVIFGSLICVGTKDLNMLILLSCYFFIGTLAFMIYRRKDNISYIISNSNAVVSMITLVVSALSLVKSRKGMMNLVATDVRLILFILLAVFCLVMIGYNILSTNLKNKDWMGFFGLGYIFLLVGVLNGIFTDSRWMNLTGLVLCTILYICVELHYRKKLEAIRGAGTYCLQLCLTIVAIGYSFGFGLLEAAVIFFVFSAGLIIFGFVVNDIFSKIMGLAINAVLLIVAYSHPLPVLFFAIGLFTLANVLMYFKNSQYSNVIKSSSYILFLLQLAGTIFFLGEKEILSNKLSGLVILVTIGLLNIIALKTKYVNNWEIQEADSSSQLTCNVVNAVMMLLALVEIADRADEPGHWIAVLMGILLFMINSYRFIKDGETWPAVYVGLKMTILLITILCSFKAGGAVLSISVFVLSIVLIVLGFYFKAKGLRIYGLVISLVCAIKLVMIDITYENTVGHAISFFISGILCFAISAIYSYAEKKYKQSEEG